MLGRTKKIHFVGIGGIGMSGIAELLLNQGFEVTTCDFNENLEPDVVGDIRELPFEDGSFPVVMACEILEHLKDQSGAK